MESESEKKVKKIVFFIGKQKFETEKSTLTVKEILVDFANVKPEEKSLALKHGNDHHEYTNIDEVIEMQEGMHFVLFDKTPTTAS
jgi:hypothetical protein